MVLAKTELFHKGLQRQANLFKALSHPARLQILQYLIQSRKCLTGDISDYFPLQRATLNQHMRGLKNAGLITSHLEGSKIVYCVNTEKIKDLEKIIAEFLEEIHLPIDFSCSLEPKSTTYE